MDEVIFETACGCRRICKVPLRGMTWEVPIIRTEARIDETDDVERRRTFEFRGKRDPWGRRIFTEVVP